MKKVIFFILFIIFVTGCSQLPKFPNTQNDEDKDFGQKVMETKLENRDIKLPDGSTIIDGNSGFDLPDLFGGSSSDFTFNKIAFNVALDKLSFMPLASVDISAGVIVTDWYSLDGGDQRVKINVRILDKELNDNSIVVKLFKQSYDGNRWVDNGQDQVQADKIKASILKEARSIQIASEM